MSARGIIILGVAGAGAYMAYKRGYLPQLAPVVEAVEPFIDRVSHILPMDQWEDPQKEKDQQLDAIKDASGGKVVPILGKDEVVTTNAYEAMLRRHWSLVSPWAKQNVGWAAAIARVENSGMKPGISGDNGTSHGVYQVKVATAETCYRAGYTRYQPTKANLLTYEGGIYFGTAEMARLAGLGKGGLDWIIQAYNGGAGFEAMGAKYVQDRAAYLQKVKKAFAALYGGTV